MTYDENLELNRLVWSSLTLTPITILLEGVPTFVSSKAFVLMIRTLRFS